MASIQDYANSIANNKLSMNIIKTNPRALQSGTTLVEMSVVIAVILLLVGVLFIGVQGWKNAANRAACLVNLATMQKAVRSYQNVNPGATTVPANQLINEGYFAAAPVCPAGGNYSPLLTAAITCPAPNNPAVTCDFAGPPTHVPSNYNNW
jgi:type II secretory pathway pseudopilin PulG